MSQTNKSQSQRDESRKQQVGSGMRGDKRRTLRVRDDIVEDHSTGKSTTFEKYSRGILDDLLDD